MVCRNSCYNIEPLSAHVDRAAAAGGCTGKRLLWHRRWFSAAVVMSNLPLISSQTQYFELLQGGYRAPSQCTRMQCLSVRLPQCRDELEGFYLKEKGCTDEKICADCLYSNVSETRCYCENPPYFKYVNYGEACNVGVACKEGEGICYRPCYTFLHITECPTDHCYWDTSSVPYVCADRLPAPIPVLWRVVMNSDPTDTVYEEGEKIVEHTNSSSYPMSFQAFRVGANGYRIEGLLLEEITSLETIFLQLDLDNSGDLNPAEFAGLPAVLSTLAQQVQSQLAAADSARRLEVRVSTLRLQSRNITVPSPRRLQSNGLGDGYVPTAEDCAALGQYYCSFDEACKADCQECGWKSAHDIAFSTCVVPTPASCRADNGKVYCLSDDLCHPAGDCSQCVDRPVVDFSQYTCLAVWWDPEPLPQWTNWICRDRNKVGMPCRHDQDCIHGLKRCLNGYCAPKQPYNPDHTCDDDLDCPWQGYYCPADPTGGENPYWIKYCREQRTDGMTCSETRECAPGTLCNLAEAQPRCRKLFSLPYGARASRDIFCSLGWRDREDKCAPPAKSKEVGRPCNSSSECTTTDATGRTGECVCKSWWMYDTAKYCLPVTGDFAEKMVHMRNYLYYIHTECGSHWTEEDCQRIGGDRAKRLKLSYECEAQQLSGGPYLPPDSCNIYDPVRFPDRCAELQALGGFLYETGAAPARDAACGVLVIALVFFSWDFLAASSGRR